MRDCRGGGLGTSVGNPKRGEIVKSHSVEPYDGWGGSSEGRGTGEAAGGRTSEGRRAGGQEGRGLTTRSNSCQTPPSIAKSRRYTSPKRPNITSDK